MSKRLKKMLNVKKYILWSRYQAEILCILFNTEHFRSVLYSRHFALYVFKVNLVLKLQGEKQKCS